jgi:transglutaminase/protease-like cytokinesis protein 3
MVALNNKEALENNSTKILKSKKGVCSDYTIFKEIANKVGIDTETISGYTKQNGAVDPMSHAWCASKMIISGISSIQLGVLAL